MIKTIFFNDIQYSKLNIPEAWADKNLKLIQPKVCTPFPVGVGVDINKVEHIQHRDIYNMNVTERNKT